MLSAVIFDIDGTLVDSVDLHAAAWSDAMARFDRPVPAHQIRPHIGKGSDQLLPVFFTPEELERFGDKLDAARSKLFKAEYLPRVNPFPGVRSLFLRLREDGVPIALATSAKQEELGHYKQLCEIDDLVSEETSSDDAAKSKPHPDIFEAALRRLGSGIHPGAVRVVGDTPYDAFAAGRAGLPAVGVLCGGFPEQDLRQAGCRAIFQGPADLLARYRDFWRS